MSVKNLFRMIPLFSLVAGGCQGNLTGGTRNTDGTNETDDTSQFLTNYGARPNGTGIHVASTQPESWVGLTNASTNWFMSGFAQQADGSWWATGWYSRGAGLRSADAKVVSATQNGKSAQLQAIRTTGSTLSIDLRDAAGAVTALTHASLIGLALSLAVPDPVGVTSSSYQLRFSSAENVDGYLLANGIAAPESLFNLRD